jgi:hypothetical protein
MTNEYGGILIYSKNIVATINHIYKHYNIATK